MNANRKKLNPAFRGDFNGNQAPVDSVPYALLKQARHSGQLNLSNRGITELPDKVWKVNVDVPEEAKNVALGDDDERWWDQVDLVKLIVASNQLTSIPDDVKHLPALTLIDAHDNKIENISDEIGNLRELSKLNISHNELTSLPSSLCNVDTLVCLQAIGNKIRELPLNIGSLRNLEELELSSNSLERLPESFGQLHRITKLNLSKNSLTELPRGFEQMTALRDLDVSSNCLETLPAGFGELTSLEILECRYNQILHVTPFERPASIKQLFLGYNKIQRIDADVFSKLPHLVTLDIRDNAIGEIPEEITQLRSLERIDMSNNSVAVLPYMIGRMSLKSIVVDGNPLRSIRRDIIAKGTQAILEHLRSRIPVDEKSTEDAATNHQSTGIFRSDDDDKPIHSNMTSTDKDESRVVQPSKQAASEWEIATTKALKYVGKKVTNIPEEVWLIGAKITTVDFSQNLLTEFPAQFVEHYTESLSELTLARNKLSYIPDTIGSLTKLSFVDFSNNGLSTLPDMFAQLPHLLQVNVAYNSFKEIPPVLFRTPCLQTILIANNQLTDIPVDGLLQLTTIQTLDLSNNAISHIPPRLGKVESLRSLQLEGNSFRQPRAAILQKGTQSVLAYLRDRLPTP